MKKIILIVVIVLTIYTLNNKKEELLIPKEAIRFRVIANSDKEEDQNTKILIRDTIQKQMQTDLNNKTNLEEARTTIKDNINSYQSLIKTTLNNNDIATTFNVNYGMNYFPEKVYKGVKYEEGYYESLVVTLGNGSGNNWWCVLFPPLCLLEAEETEDTTEVEYKFFISELIDKYFK